MRKHPDEMKQITDSFTFRDCRPEANIIEEKQEEKEEQTTIGVLEIRGDIGGSNNIDCITSTDNDFKENLITFEGNEFNDEIENEDQIRVEDLQD